MTPSGAINETLRQELTRNVSQYININISRLIDVFMIGCLWNNPRCKQRCSLNVEAEATANDQCQWCTGSLVTVWSAIACGMACYPKELTAASRICGRCLEFFAKFLNVTILRPCDSATLCWIYAKFWDQDKYTRMIYWNISSHISTVLVLFLKLPGALFFNLRILLHKKITLR